MRLTILARETLEFVPPTLAAIGDDRRSLGGETPTISVRLDNTNGAITEALADPPLRSRCYIEVSGVVIEGVLQSIALGVDATLQVEV